MENNNHHPNLNQPDIKRFIFYLIVYISVGIGISMLGPLLPFLAKQVSIPLGQMGFAFTAQNLGYLIGTLGGGRLFDRFKTHRLIIICLISMILTGLLIPCVTEFYVLLTILFFFGLGVGAVDVGTNLNIVWIFQSKVGPYLNALHLIFGVGAFITPIIFVNVLNWTGDNLSFAVWTLMLLFIPGIIGLAITPSPENPETIQTDAMESEHNPGLILMFMLAIFFAVGVQIGFSGWIFSYVADLGIADTATTSLINALFWASLSIGRLIAIPVSKKVAPGVMALFNFSLLVLVLIVLLIWPTHLGMIQFGTAGVGLATSILFPTLLSYAKTRMKITGRTTGLLYLGSSLSMMLLPLLLGQVFDRFGGYQMILVVFIVALLGLGTMILLAGKHVKL
jgi:fucose permease